MTLTLLYGVLQNLYNLFSAVFLIIYYVSFSLFLLIGTTLTLLCLYGIVTNSFVVDVGSKSRKCGKPGCKGFKHDDDYKYKEQTEECLRLGGKDVEEVDNLPVKHASEEDDFDIEVLLAELKKRAPANGRGVYLFTDKCGCRVAKLEAWGIKEHYISKEDELCCICLSKYSNKAVLRQLPCSHFYHKECIDGWINTKDRCPLCRAKFDRDVLTNQIKVSWRGDSKTPYWRRIAGYVPWFKIFFLIFSVRLFYICFRFMYPIV
ncbi:uncharacterized protein LOC141723964 [Apium graveolens]|uniref:uncharacterized protein LOC141723964 n=1 Tax=Apium graveolens TaxID=4045 RepID=UPI003D7950A6